MSRLVDHQVEIGILWRENEREGWMVIATKTKFELLSVIEFHMRIGRVMLAFIDAIEHGYFLYVFWP